MTGKGNQQPIYRQKTPRGTEFAEGIAGCDLLEEK